MAGRRDEQRYADKRQRILDAAASVFRAKGYESARLEDIAENLGVTKASVYYYFPKKSDLLIEICARAVEDSLARQGRILEQDRPADERLREAVIDHIRGMSANYAVWTIFFREHTIEQTDDPRWKAIQKGLREFGRHFEALVEEGVATGVFRPVNVRVISNAILGMLNWSHRWIHSENSIVVESEVVELIDGGLLQRR